jgi:hypothetical protein
MIAVALPLPLLWVICLSTIITGIICFKITGGCALSRYEYYFSGKKGKNKFIKRVFEDFGLKLPHYLFSNVMYGALFTIVIITLYMYRIHGALKTTRLDTMTVVVTLSLSCVIVALISFTAPRPDLEKEEKIKVIKKHESESNEHKNEYYRTKF